MELITGRQQNVFVAVIRRWVPFPRVALTRAARRG